MSLDGPRNALPHTQQLKEVRPSGSLYPKKSSGEMGTAVTNMGYLPTSSPRYEEMKLPSIYSLPPQSPTSFEPAPRMGPKQDGSRRPSADPSSLRQHKRPRLSYSMSDSEKRVGGNDLGRSVPASPRAEQSAGMPWKCSNNGAVKS